MSVVQWSHCPRVASNELSLVDEQLHARRAQRRNYGFRIDPRGPSSVLSSELPSSVPNAGQ